MMESGHATKGSPLGCVVGTFAIIGLIFTIASSVLLWKAFQIPPDKRPKGALHIPAGATVFGILVTLISTRISINMLKATDWKNFDPDDPTSQM